MLISHLCVHSLLFSYSKQPPALFSPDRFCFCFFLAICCPGSSDCYICRARVSCGNWLLTVKDLLTLKPVVCALRAPCCLGQLQQLRWFNSPKPCLLFPPSELQKSKCALLPHSLRACSEQTQRCLMCAVYYPAAYSTACRKSLPGPRGDPGEHPCGPEAPFAAPLCPPTCSTAPHNVSMCAHKNNENITG